MLSSLTVPLHGLSGMVAFAGSADTGHGLFSGENLVALLTLTALEIVLGIDNVIFIAILAGRLPDHQQARARQYGIGAAVVTRILLLLSITWVMGLTAPWFEVGDHVVSGRDLILLGGGLFLIAKSTFEIHDKLEAAEGRAPQRRAKSLIGVVTQIMIIDIVFSLDSVITAVGLSGVLWVMITAIVVAAVLMILAAGAVSRFVEAHPTMKILALSFLILIGALLVMEGWNPEAAHRLHLKNYAYFAMAFSFAVELVNMRLRPPAPVVLHRMHLPEAPATRSRDEEGEG